ncbi:hypothetical protein FXF61_05230 [Pseudomonas sp. C27(2019)]|uniref:BRO family protein n=1 Tax=Pseudomonas sp. C27(2019) TaxID=2604941 RepID=UPI001245D1A0|nr:BRO family protein [Pseudomonas sp. C27(2019)]QEY58602.1 hypothetical protein FXF61_05230 [Pseudomonas sp. C27(2019)]
MNDQHHSFEQIKQTDENGIEYWSARELAPVLEYRDWRNFLKVIDKSIQACSSSGQHVNDHFVEATKMVTLGSGAERELADIKLSRYACYLVVQNGDPSKPVIAAGQTYFAIQTRRQELADDTSLQNLN